MLSQVPNTNGKSDKKLPVAVIGGGPIGLAAAAHLVQRGETPLVFESSSAIAGGVRSWAHVPTFSPWKYNVDPAAVEILEAHGWEMPEADALPTGGELITDYLQPLADTPEIAPHIRLSHRVTAISRRRIDKMKDFGRNSAPFIIQADTPTGEQRFLARAVIDASGTWATHNPIGSDGLPAIGETANKAHIFYGIPDILGKHGERYINRRTAVIGGGHSAINALLELSDLQATYPETEIVWVLRKGNVESAYGGLGNDALPGRGALGVRIKELVDSGTIEVVTPFWTTAIARENDQLTITGDMASGEQQLFADEIIAATGSRPDLSLLSELRLDLHTSVESPTFLAPLIDPNVHSCGTVYPHGEKELRHPEKNFYIVGMKSYGRAPTFLMLTGYEQVRSVVAALVGDMEAAGKVELVLPETGVCGVPDSADPNAACCTPNAIVGEACCDTQPALSLESISLDAIPVGGAPKSCC